MKRNNHIRMSSSINLLFVLVGIVFLSQRIVIDQFVVTAQQQQQHQLQVPTSTSFQYIRSLFSSTFSSQQPVVAAVQVPEPNPSLGSSSHRSLQLPSTTDTTQLNPSAIVFTLMNADTDQPIEELGDTIDLTALNTTNLNIGVSIVQNLNVRVQYLNFSFDQNRIQKIEFGIPFALGNNSDAGGNITYEPVPELRERGCHTLRVAVYAKNVPIVIKIVTFTIVSAPVVVPMVHLKKITPGLYGHSLTGVLTGELRQFHKVTIGFDGPFTSDVAMPNPFLDYRLDVTFVHLLSNTTYIVPGYYGADGNAANTGATSGSVWLVHFTPDRTGIWKWTTSFTTGTNVALLSSTSSSSSASGCGTSKSAGYFDHYQSTFKIRVTNKALSNNGRDFRGKGQLKYVNEHYLQFNGGKREYFYKIGVDSPENLLAYDDFYNTPNYNNLRKSWAPHVSDFVPGNPTWAGGRGKGIIGALNYLSNVGLNAVSFLSFSIQGDDQNVFPYISDKKNDFVRIDVAKTAQWEIVFEHATNNGLFLHFKTKEMENDQLLDSPPVGLEDLELSFGIERQLYYRELIARFSHHLALNWNIGEETSISNALRLETMRYIDSLDPYHHPIVVHTLPQQKERVYRPLLGEPIFSGASLQSFPENLAEEIRYWVNESSIAGHKWIITNDEQGPLEDGVVPDEIDPTHDTIRQNVLWATYMNGGAGVEYYFGYNYTDSDLSCQNYRSRHNMWIYSKIAYDFFTRLTIPLVKMTTCQDSITSSNVFHHNSGNVWCRRTILKSDIIVLYLTKGGSVDLSSTSLGVPRSAIYEIQWFDPLIGFPDSNATSQLSLLTGTKQFTNGPTINTGQAPYQPNEQDWVVLLRRV